jgi:hypothetical protein
MMSTRGRGEENRFSMTSRIDRGGGATLLHFHFRRVS